MVLKGWRARAYGGIIVPDTTPPTVPTGFGLTVSALDVILEWDANPDAAVFKVWRDGVHVWTTTSNTWTDTVTPGDYLYAVSAVDGSPAANESAACTGIVAEVTATPVGYTPSLDESGATDVSAGMAAFVAGLPVGATITLPTPATYQMETTLLLATDGITLKGNGSVFRASDRDGGPGYGTTLYPNRNRSCIDLTGEDQTIDGLVIVGANPTAGFDGVYDAAYEAQHGINVVSAVNALIKNCDISKVWGDFVCVARGLPATPRSVGTTIEDNVMSGNGRQGIALVGADDTIIQRNVMDEMRRTVFDIEPGNPSYDGIDGALIQDNTIGRHKLNFVSGRGNGQADNVTVQNNAVVGGVNGCSLVSDVGDPNTVRVNWTFAGNTGTMPNYWANKGRLLRFENIDGLHIYSNISHLHPSHIMFGVDVQNCTDTSVGWGALTGVATASPSWPAGANGYARYMDAAETVLGYSPTYPAP